MVFGHNGNFCGEEKIKIKPAQLMLETFIRNPNLFSSLKCFWEGAADVKDAIFSR